MHNHPPVLPLRSAPKKVYALLGLGVSAVALLLLGLALDHFEIDKRPIRLIEIPSWILRAFSEDAWFTGKHVHPVIVIGALLARLTFYGAILWAVTELFSRRLRSFLARTASNHVLVIGNAPAALDVLRELRRQHTKAVHVVERETDLTGSPARRQTVLQFSLAELNRGAGLSRASRVVIDMGDPQRNAALARDIEEANRKGRSIPVSCNLESTRLGDEIHTLLDGYHNLLVYDAGRLAVRDTLARHPLFSLADRQAASTVHLLIIGFGRLGQLFLEEGVQNSFAGKLGQPLVTIIDLKAGELEATFKQDRPEHYRAADLVFLPCDVLRENLDGQGSRHAEVLFERDRRAPVTAIAACLPQEAGNNEFVLRLRAVQRRTGCLVAPIFMRSAAAGSAGDLFAAGPREHVIEPMSSAIPIRVGARMLAGDILGTSDRDRLAKLLHQRFLKLAGGDQSANAAWRMLPETFRRANRHAADHVAAKLWSIGLCAERRATADVFAVDKAWYDTAGATAFVENSLQNSPATYALAELEHRRWMAERVIDGWTFSDRRDDDLKRHPDLRPFDDPLFSDKDRQKDVETIQLINELAGRSLKQSGDRLMPEITIGIAGHLRIDKSSFEQAKPAIREQITDPLRALSHNHVITLVSPLAPGADLDAVDFVASQLHGATDLRLIQIEAVPYPVCLRRAFGGDPARRDEAIEKLLISRRKLLERFARVDVVRLPGGRESNDEVFRTPALFEAGLRRANAYLSRRSDVLCVLWDGKDGAARPGGTAELVAYRSGKVAIPADLDPGPSRRWRQPPTTTLPSLIHISVRREGVPAPDGGQAKR